MRSVRTGMRSVRISSLLQTTLIEIFRGFHQSSSTNSRKATFERNYRIVQIL